MNYGLSKSTDKLRKHLERRHREILDQSLQESQNSNNDNSSYVTTDELYPNSLLKWCVMNFQPLSVCEDHHFRAMIETANPSARKFCRDTLSKQLTEKKAEVLIKLREMLKKEEVSITSDGCSSSKSFILNSKVLIVDLFKLILFF